MTRAWTKSCAACSVSKCLIFLILSVLTAVGKMPVRRDVLMCVSEGRSAGEIACRRCEGIGLEGRW